MLTRRNLLLGAAGSATLLGGRIPTYAQSQGSPLLTTANASISNIYDNGFIDIGNLSAHTSNISSILGAALANGNGDLVNSLMPQCLAARQSMFIDPLQQPALYVAGANLGVDMRGVDNLLSIDANSVIPNMGDVYSAQSQLVNSFNDCCSDLPRFSRSNGGAIGVPMQNETCRD